MGQTSQVITYTNTVALSLDKLHPKIADAISKGHKLLFFMRRKGHFEGVPAGGPQLRVPIRYAIKKAKPIGAYGTVNLNPSGTVTSAYYPWGQGAADITFSDMEDFQQAGPQTLEKAVKTKRDDAEASLMDLIDRALILGQADSDGTSFTSPLQGDDASETLCDPIGKLVAYDPTASLTIGGIDQSANAWWQNRYKTSAATTRKGWLEELDELHAETGYGMGGSPDFLVSDPKTFVLYRLALSDYYRNPDYKRGDLPFDNLAFHSAPLIPEEMMYDIAAGSTTVTEGTLFMFNSEFLGFTYDQGGPDRTGSFRVDAVIKPANQLLKSSLMPIRGAFWSSNRKKQGVMGAITIATLRNAAT